MKPRLLDLCCGAAMGYYRAGFEVVGVDIKGVDNIPYGMVEYIYGKIRRITMSRLWQSPQGSSQEWQADKFALPSVRSQASGDSKTRQLEDKRIAPTMEGWHPCRTERLPLNSRAVRQPIYFNGRFQGAGI